MIEQAAADFGTDANEMGEDEQKRVSELTRQQKRMIREKRFGGSNQYQSLDPTQIMATIEAEKQKRQERAEKFGLSDTVEA